MGVSCHCTAELWHLHFTVSIFDVNVKATHLFNYFSIIILVTAQSPEKNVGIVHLCKPEKYNLYVLYQDFYNINVNDVF